MTPVNSIWWNTTQEEIGDKLRITMDEIQYEMSSQKTYSSVGLCENILIDIWLNLRADEKNMQWIFF